MPSGEGDGETTTYTGDVRVGGPPDTRDFLASPSPRWRVGPHGQRLLPAALHRHRGTGLIDAANDADTLLGLVGGVPLAIVTTHRHRDHWAALQAVQQATGALTAAHPEDAGELPVPVTDRSGTAT